MKDCITENINRGIKSGIYREDIDVDFISKIYFSCMTVLKDKDLFPLNNSSMNYLMNNYLEYHLRGICTPKGIEILLKFTNSNQS